MALSEMLAGPSADNTTLAHRLMQTMATGGRGASTKRCRPTDELERGFERIAKIAVASRHGAGESVVYEGDAATHLFQLAYGFAHESIVLANGRRHIVDFVLQGEFCGLPEDGRHPVTVPAATATRAVPFPRARFEEILDETPSLALCLARETEKRLHRAQHKLVALGCLNASQRTALFLKWLAREARGDASQQRGPAGGDNESDRWHLIPATRQDIGDYLGLSLETVCRAITRLKSLGLVAMRDQHHFRVVDQGRLDCYIEADAI